jgi:iron(III) transport system ATP-binding protein
VFRLLFRSGDWLVLFLVLILAGCDRSGRAPTLAVKSWHAWMLPPEGPVQPTPRSLTTGPNNEVAVLDTAGRVIIYDANGTLLRQWKMLDVQFGKPEGIVWLTDGRIVVCDTHYHRLVWFDQTGKVLKTVGQRGVGNAEFVFPVGITKDQAENLYVCEYGGHDRIQVFTRDGEWLREFGEMGTGPGKFQRPSGLVWHDGRVYIADAVNNRVLVFKDSGEFLEKFGGENAPVFDLPYDITLAPDGHLYVIEYGAGRLSKLTLSGKVIGQYAKSGSGEAEFATPWGLAVDSRMRVLVADTKNRRIVALQL